MKRPLSRILSESIAIATAIFLPAVSLANPNGEQVAAGQVSFDRSRSGVLTINQASDRSIINWQKFSIDAGEKTTFLQPNAKSAVLNRVTGGDVSSLQGMLNANGHVYLINPNGIVIGAGAQINVGALTASTLDVSDTQFLAAGDLNFAGTSTAGITNLGAVHAATGDVFMFAHTVDNAGSISAPQGTVGLGAGSEILLKPAGDERVFIKAHSGDSGSVVNRGTISAVAAELKASGSAYALAINNTGTIEATGVAQRGGRVFLTADGGNVAAGGVVRARNGDGSGGAIKVAARRSPVGGAPEVSVSVTGLLDASSTAGDGGQITVTGDQVNALAGSRIDASGVANGGSILFGGGEHGADPTVSNAQTATVEKTATLAADGGVNGGRVIVWSDLSTHFDGAISATSTSSPTGQGGFVEVSGKSLLAFNGTADTRAASGQAGTLLLDPQDLLITGTTLLDQNLSGPTPYEPSGAGSKLSYTTLLLALQFSNVTVQTGSAPGPGAGDITFGASALDGFLYPALLVPRTLTISAAHDININAPITSLAVIGSLSLNLQANTAATGGNVNLNQAITLPNGTLTTGGDTINASGGLSINGLTSLIGHNVSLLTPLVLNTAADFTVDASNLLTINAGLSNTGTGGLLLHGATIAVNAAVSTVAGDLQVNATVGDLTLGLGGSLQTGGGAIHLTSAGDVTFNPACTLLSNGGNISVGANGAVALGGLNAGAGQVTISALSGAITQVAGTLAGAQATLTAGLGIGASGAPLATAVNTLGFTAGGDVHLLQSGAVTVTGATIGNNGLIDLRTAGDGALTIGGAGLVAQGSGNVLLNAGNGVLTSTANLSLGGTVHSDSGSITLIAGANGGALTNAIGGTLATGLSLGSSLLNVSTTGDVTLQAGGDIGALGARLNLAVGGTLNTAGQAASAGLFIGALGDTTLGNIGAAQTIDLRVLGTNAGGDGSLTIGQSLTALAGGTLSLLADHDVTVNAGLTSPGAITISAGLDPFLNGALSLHGPVLCSGGPVELGAAGDVTLAAGAAVITTGNLIHLASQAGQLALDSSVVLNSGGGDIHLSAGTDIGLSQVLAGAGDIVVQAGANITGSVGGSIDANHVDLTAGLHIGTSVIPLVTAVTQLGFTAAGDVYLLQNGAVTVTGATTANNGLIDLRTAGDGTLTIGGAGLSAQGAGTILLSAGNGVLTSTANLALGGTVHSDSGSITLIAGANDGVLTNAIGGTLATGANLTSSLLNVSTIGDVTLQAGGDIGALGARLNLAVGGTLNVSGQGSGAGLFIGALGDTTLGTINSAQTIDVRVLGSNLGADGSLTIGQPLVALMGGTLSLVADHNVTINAGLTAPGSIVVAAGLDSSITGALTLNGPALCTGGPVDLTATGNLVLNAGSGITTGGGLVHLGTQLGDLTLDSSVALNSAGGEVNLFAGGNAELGNILAGTGDVLVQVGGSIMGAASGSVDAHSIALTAGLGIGTAGTSLVTAAAQLAFSAGGDVCLTNLGDVVAAGQTTVDASINLGVTGGSLTIGPVTILPTLTGSLAAQGEVQIGLGTSGTGTIQVGVTGDLTINAPVQTGAGVVTITAGGDATIGAGVGSSGADVSINVGLNLTLTGGGTVSAPGGNIDITVDAGAGTGSGGGGLNTDPGTAISAGGTVTLNSDSPSNNNIDPATTITGTVVVNIYKDPGSSSGGGSGGSGGLGGSSDPSTINTISTLAHFSVTNSDGSDSSSTSIATANFGQNAMWAFFDWATGQDSSDVDDENSQRDSQPFLVSYRDAKGERPSSLLQTTGGIAHVDFNLSSHSVLAWRYHATPPSAARLTHGRRSHERRILKDVPSLFSNL